MATIATRLDSEGRFGADSTRCGAAGPFTVWARDVDAVASAECGLEIAEQNV